MKEKRKKKINLYMTFVKNKAFLAGWFVFCLVFILLYDNFIVNAQNVTYSDVMQSFNGTGSFSAGSLVKNYYELTKSYNDHYPCLDQQKMISLYDGSGQLGLGTRNATTFFGNDYDPDFILQLESGERTAFLPISVSCLNQSANCVEGSGYYLLTYAPSTASSQQWIDNYKFWGDGKIAMVNYLADSQSNTQMVVLSDGPLNYYRVRSRAFDGGQFLSVEIGYIDETDSHGFYIYYLEDYSQPLFADLPIYLPSTDGASGFVDSSDFSLDSDNVNFNNLIVDEIVSDPNAEPEEPEVPAETDAKYHLNFKDVTSYGGSGIKHFYHNNDFTFPEYVITNASQFKLKFSYDVHLKLSNDQYESTYSYSTDVLMSSFLAQSKRFNTGSRYTVSLHSDNLLNGNVSLTSALKSVVHTVQGTNNSYADPDSIFEEFAGDVLSATTGNLQILPNVSADFSNSIDTLYVVGVVTIYDSNNSNYESYSYRDYHDFLTGKEFVLSNANTVSPYQQENQPPTVWDNTLNTNSGGNIGSGSVIQNANPTIIVQGQGSGGLTQAFTLDDVNIASLADTYNYIISTLGDTNDQNGFWAIMKTTYDYIPEQIWNVMLLGISTVIGICCVRVALTSFRNK